MATITIKIKGAGAQLGAIGTKGAAAGTKLGVGGALLHGAQREVEIEGGRALLHKKAAAQAVHGPLAAVPTTPPHAVGSVTKLGAGAGKAGTIWTGTGTSLGLGVGLGTIGPILLVTALGLVATGIYIYIRSQQVPRAPDRSDEQPAAA